MLYVYEQRNKIHGIKRCRINSAILILSFYILYTRVSLYCSLIHVQDSKSLASVDGQSADYAKSYDAVVFDVLKVTPEEFAVS